MKKCVFAGSFDPITEGHMHVIERCSMMFEEVIVALGVNIEKKYAYPESLRLEMVKAACKRFRNVVVKKFEGYLADFMREENAIYYVRGIRDKKDIDFEEKCFKVTSSINEDIQMMFFQSPKNLCGISSTNVKELMKKGKSIAKLVPEEIIPYLKEYELISKGKK